ncbi:MAG: serine/threonine protein kinase [Myxococcales bacterium]|nr:serine/threonine protein kinase [Myxococcales bacterium]
MFTCPVCARVYPKPGTCTSDGAALFGGEPPSLLGQQVGSYRVERLIGQGGMGEVYLGVQPEIGARVAIKVLTGDAAASPSLVERFFAEARAVNLIHHESIVNVLDMARTADGRPYLVMEHLEGAPLGQLFAASAGSAPIGTLARLIIEVLGALTAAHAIGITHRDLKPENVFVTSLGRAKVLDFGVAKLNPELGVAGPGTQSHALLGTPHYMSPEQARGQPVDARSDLYSVGVILFEGVTGQRPFHADSLYDLLEHHVRTPPPSPRALRPELPPAFEALILRALEKDPARRFQSANELALALSEALKGLPEQSFAPLSSASTERTVSLSPGPATPATLAASVSAAPAHTPLATGVSATQASRWPLVVGGLVGLGMVLTAVVAVAWLALGQRTPAPPRPATAEVSVDLRRFDAVAYFPTAERHARGYFKDAELVTLVIPKVDHTGLVDLEATQAHVGYSFRARGVGQGDPMGSVVLDECVAAVVVSRNGVVATKSQGMCNTMYVAPPRCSPARVMQKLGAQPGQRATLQYFFAYSKGPTWSAAFDGMNESRESPDDC